MNKLVVIGHEFSQPEKIFEILVERGLVQANPSHRDRLTPVAINKILMDVGTLNVQTGFYEVDSIWNSLYLDLFLANIKHSIWGWVDGGMLKLLDYYNSLDSKTYFILSYSHPSSFKFDGHIPSYELKSYVEKSLKEWYEYNSLLFKFYEKNRSRCILVNSEQVFNSVSNYLIKIESYIHHSFKDNPGNFNNTSDDYSIVQLSERIESKKQKDFNVNHYFINKFIEKDDQRLELYSVLQENSDLPNLESSKELDEIDILLKLYDTQQSYIYENHVLQTKLNQTEQKYKQNLLYSKQLEEYKYQNANLHQQFQSLALKLETASKKGINEKFLQEEIKTKTQLLGDLSSEKEKIQKELFIYKNLNEKEKNELLKKSGELSDIQTKFKKLEDELSKKAKDLLVEKQKTEKLQRNISDLKSNVEFEKQNVKTENQILTQQLSKLQEELEKYYMENLRVKKKDQPNADSIKYYGAAERVKRELPYILGAKIIENSKDWKGRLSLPITLYKDIPTLKKIAEEEKSLPSLDQYVDTQQAEKVKGHLSYKIGKALVDVKENPAHILTLPLKLRKEYINFSLNKRKRS